MTLIVSALTNEIAVVAADGLEFRHRADGPKYIETVDRQKIFLIPERIALLGIRDVHENMKREMSNKFFDSWFHVRALSPPLGDFAWKSISFWPTVD